MIEAALVLLLRRIKTRASSKVAIHGGRDSAAELALAGTVDSSVGQLFQATDFGSAPPDGFELYTSGTVSQRIFPAREFANKTAQCEGGSAGEDRISAKADD